MPLTELDRIDRLLSSWRIRYGTELHMQDDVEHVLRQAGIANTREAPLGQGRIDFLTSDGVGIECKIDGGPTAVLAQLLRYASFEQVNGLVLVSSRPGHRFRVSELAGKPLRIVWAAANL